jgi:hypothetical protein
MLSSTDIIRVSAIEIFNSLVDSSGKIVDQLNESFQQIVFQASKQYNQNYIERHACVKVLGMREPITLDAIYTDVQLVDSSVSRRFHTLETLDQFYRNTQKRRFHPTPERRLPGLHIANQHPYLMVLGGPGIGKSTFLRKVGLEALNGPQDNKFQYECIPVFLELKEFSSGAIDFEAAIAKEFEICGFPYADSFTRAALEQGKLLILLDGVDEIPTERQSFAIVAIRDFVDRYDQNRFIASCRKAAYRYNLRRFTDVEIADFTDQQILHFIESWFVNHPRRGQECWQKLMSAEYAATKELTHTPLLLTLTCLLYEKAGQFPTNRATLYEKAVRVLLEEWSGEKGLPQEILYRGLDTKRKELLLSQIAHDAFVANQLFLPRRELVKKIEFLLKEMLPDEHHIDGDKVLKSIEVQHGILVERAEGIYSFSHLTLQEYLTAQYLADTRRLMDQVMLIHLTDERWREVFLLLAGLQRADEMLLRMEKRAHGYVTAPALQSLLNWASDITQGSGSPHKPAVKRIAAIFLALDLGRALALDYVRVRALDLDIDLARTLALTLDRSLELNRALDLALARVLNLELAVVLAIDIARKYDQTRIFSGVDFNQLHTRLSVIKSEVQEWTEPEAVRKSVIETVQTVWLEELKLQPEWVQLSPTDALALQRYLIATLLMVQCKRSAVWVLPRTWAGIEARLLCLPWTKQRIKQA